MSMGTFLHLKYVIEFAEFLKGNLGVLRKQFLSTCLSIYMPVSLFFRPFTLISLINVEVGINVEMV